MSLSLGATNLGYSMLDEIWQDYKYPTSNTYSQRGYDGFNDYDFNEKVYTDNPNIQGQSVLSEKRPKLIEYPKRHTIFEGFQTSPMDHPSTSKPELENMYNYKPYNKDDNLSYIENKNRRYECDEYIEHIENCSHCYEHLRRRLNLTMSNNLSPNITEYFANKNINIVDLALLFMGSVLIYLVIDTLLAIRRKYKS